MNLSPDNGNPSAAEPASDETDARIARDIKNGVIAACFSLASTLLMTVLAMSQGKLMGYSAWNFIDAALIAVLAWGMYRRSRIAVTLMLVYFVLSKIMEVSQTGNVSSLLVGAVFAYFYTRAALATYQYHQRRHAAQG